MMVNSGTDEAGGNDWFPREIIFNTFLLERIDREDSNKRKNGTGFAIDYKDKKYMITSTNFVSHGSHCASYTRIRNHTPDKSAFDLIDCNFEWVKPKNPGNSFPGFSVMEILNSEHPCLNKFNLAINSRDVGNVGEDVFYAGFPRRGVFIDYIGILDNLVLPIPLIHRGVMATSKLVNGFIDPLVDGGPVISRRFGQQGKICILGVASKNRKEQGRPDPRGHFSIVDFSVVLDYIDRCNS